MSFDKAEWQYDSARESYCEKFNKNPNLLTDEDEEIIWGFAGNHIAFFITWLIRHDFLGDLHYEDDFEGNDLEAVKKQEKTGMDIYIILNTGKLVNYSLKKFLEASRQSLLFFISITPDILHLPTSLCPLYARPQEYPSLLAVP